MVLQEKGERTQRHSCGMVRWQASINKEESSLSKPLMVLMLAFQLLELEENKQPAQAWTGELQWEMGLPCVEGSRIGERSQI